MKILTDEQIKDLQKEVALLEQLVNDLCEYSSAEEVYKHLLTVGSVIGVTEQDLQNWGFNPFEDENVDYENVSEDEEGDEEDDDEDYHAEDNAEYNAMKSEEAHYINNRR